MARILDGRYELRERLGRGGMGVVWRARDLRIERDVAVKLLVDDLPDSQRAELLIREARAAGRLFDPHIVAVLDLGATEDGSYVVMELVRGVSLAEHLAGLKEPLPLAVALDWTDQICRALETAHRHGVVHRDIKPANVLLTGDGRLKVADFGIAKIVETLASLRAESHREPTGTVAGTPGYMAPEQFRGEPVSGRTDLYAVGCLLYLLVTGTTPFPPGPLHQMMYRHLNEEPPPPGTRRPGLSPRLDDLVLSLLAKDPDSRPRDAAEVRARLAELSREPSRPLLPPPSPPPAPRPRPAGGLRLLPLGPEELDAERSGAWHTLNADPLRSLGYRCAWEDSWQVGDRIFTSGTGPDGLPCVAVGHVLDAVDARWPGARDLDELEELALSWADRWNTAARSTRALVPISSLALGRCGALACLWSIHSGPHLVGASRTHWGQVGTWAVPYELQRVVFGTPRSKSKDEAGRQAARLGLAMGEALSALGDLGPLDTVISPATVLRASEGSEFRLVGMPVGPLPERMRSLWSEEPIPMLFNWSGAACVRPRFERYLYETAGAVFSGLAYRLHEIGLMLYLCLDNRSPADLRGPLRPVLGGWSWDPEPLRYPDETYRSLTARLMALDPGDQPSLAELRSILLRLAPV